MGKKDKAWGTLCFLAIIGMWAGFFKLIDAMPAFFTPGSIVLIILAIILALVVTCASIFLAVIGCVLWSEE